MAGPIKIAILADAGPASKAFKETSVDATKMGSSVEKSGSSVSDAFGKVGSAAVGLNASVDTVGSALESVDAIMNSGSNESRRLARAQIDVEQAMLDGEQAAIDLRQATEDLNQAEIDGSQSKVDYKQAQIDAKQANLDATVAQKEYNAAVRENGKGSEEARQAAIDLEQAKADLTQAEVDAKQATADGRQSQLDASQAMTDGKQATVDAKTAVLDLGDAQRELDPTAVQQAMMAFQTYAPALALATISLQGLASATMLATAKTVIMSGVTKGAAAAQWLLNAALTANPIGLIIVGLVALGAGLVLAYKKSETFRKVVDGAFRAVKNAASSAFNWVRANWPKIQAIVTAPIKSAMAVSKFQFNLFMGVVRTARNVVVAVASRIGSALRTIGAVMRSVRETIRNAVSNVVSYLGRIASRAREIPGQIRGYFRGAAGWLVSAGKDVVRGLWNGISQMGGWLASQISGFISRNVTGKIKGVLGINSPSKVGMELGGYFGQGLGKGIAASSGIVSRASGQLATSAARGLGSPSFSAAATSSSRSGGGGLELTVASTGRRLDDLLIELLRESIRIRAKGGANSVQRVLGAA